MLRPDFWAGLDNSFAMLTAFTEIGILSVGLTFVIAAGDIDLGVLWGPMAGYYAMQANPPMKVVPLVKEHSGPRLAYYITMGVRGADQEWKRQLNRLIAENQPEINRLLASFGVPLLDDKDRLIGVEAPATRQ